jgi:hypothetical protein
MGGYDARKRSGLFDVFSVILSDVKIARRDEVIENDCDVYGRAWFNFGL